MTVKKFAVLCGGDGREREVSLRSGRAVCDALNDAGISTELLDLQKISEVERVKNFDGVFIAMHGDWGEGGELQNELEKINVPYTGSGPKSSARAMHKWEAHKIFKSENILTPDALLLPQDYEQIISLLGRDVVVKPCKGGSTVGITIIHDATPKKINEAANFARENYNSEIMIEKYIDGREITCAVWEHDGKIKALPVIEIIPHAGFYDYANKYTAGATEYITPAKITPEECAQVQAMAERAHKVLGCSDYSRADFRLTPDGVAYILEVNTAPGMTATSLVPKAAKAIGVSMSEFVSEIMKRARCKK